MTALVGENGELVSTTYPDLGVRVETQGAGHRGTRPVQGEGLLVLTVTTVSVVVALAVGVLLGGSLPQLVVLLGGWLLCWLPAARRLAEAPVAGPARALAATLVGSAALVGLADLDRQLLSAWWPALVAAALGAGTTTWLAGHARPGPRVLLVGDAVTVQKLTERWPTAREGALAGALVLPDDQSAEVRVTGVLDQVEATDATVVLVLCGSLDVDEVRMLGWQLEGRPVRIAVATAAGHASPGRVRLTRLGDSTVAMLAPSRPDPVCRAAKALVDRLGAAVLLLLLAPMLLALGVAIRLDSAGPAVFRQVRVGRDGRAFTMYKFRSMVVDAEARKNELSALDEGNGVLFKMRQDPRITGIGRLLRRASLDELPQLVNVLRGEMSLVGPRPALPQEVATYDDRARRRLAVKPGLTGLWQVSGRSDLGWDASVALDLDYADNVSITRDFAIGLATVRAVTEGHGAY